MIVGVILKFYPFELFKFGGTGKRGKLIDSFYIGTLKNGDPSEPIEWQLAPEYRLKQKMCRFGWIQCGHFIVTFGGSLDSDRYTDKIYTLDLRQNCGWIESPVKCPKKEYFRASLDDSQHVHLNARYWTHLSQILPQIGQELL